MAQELPAQHEESLIRRSAAETRERAAAARAMSRELSKGRQELLEALRRGWHEQASLLGQLSDARDELREAVRSYAKALRQQEVPPEKMLIDVKRLVHETYIARAPRGQELMDQVVTWSIGAYYDVKTPG